MSAMCQCPDPNLCMRLKTHIWGRRWEIWNGIKVDPETARHYRTKWEAEASQNILVGPAVRQAGASGSCCGPQPDKRRLPIAPDLVDPLPEGAMPGVHHAAYYHALQQIVNAPLTYPGGEGKGVVTLGGGRYWPGVVISCRMVRELGCDWPIEVYYRSSCEKIIPSQLRGYNVEIFDLDELMKDKSRLTRGVANGNGGGWQAKWESLICTSLNQVLFLDSDAYAIRSPCKLFPKLEQHPFIYWEDLDGYAKNTKWLDVYPPGDNTEPYKVPPMQGGQFLVDRERAWRILVLTHWMCQHSDHYFNRGVWCDQDCARVAFASCGVPVLCEGKARWPENSCAFICDLDNRPAIVHRCRGKFFLDEVPSKCVGVLPHEEHVWKIYEELRAVEAI